MTFTIFINFNIFEPGLLTQFTIKLLSGKVMSYMDHAARLKVSVQKYTLFKHKKVTLSIAGTDFDYKPRDNFVFGENFNYVKPYRKLYCIIIRVCHVGQNSIRVLEYII